MEKQDGAQIPVFLEVAEDLRSALSTISAENPELMSRLRYGENCFDCKYGKECSYHQNHLTKARERYADLISNPDLRRISSWGNRL